MFYESAGALPEALAGQEPKAERQNNEQPATFLDFALTIVVTLAGCHDGQRRYHAPHTPLGRAVAIRFLLATAIDRATLEQLRFEASVLTVELTYSPERAEAVIVSSRPLEIASVRRS